MLRIRTVCSLADSVGVRSDYVEAHGDLELLCPHMTSYPLLKWSNSRQCNFWWDCVDLKDNLRLHYLHLPKGPFSHGAPQIRICIVNVFHLIPWINRYSSLLRFCKMKLDDKPSKRKRVIHCINYSWTYKDIVHTVLSYYTYLFG